MQVTKIEMHRGEEIEYPRQHPAFIRHALVGSLVGTLIVAFLAVLA